MGRKVLVTGGAGFIGSHVAAAYVAAGDDVTVLDDLSSGAMANVPSGARFVRADIRSPEARALLASGGFTLLNHHAAQVDVRISVADPVRDSDINILGLLNLLAGARTGGVRRVLFASSGGAVYVEHGRLPHGEAAAKLPLSPYGSAKLACEYYLATFAQLYGLESAVLRYSNVYGPRQNGAGEGGVVAVFAHRLAAALGRRLDARYQPARAGELRRSALAIDKAAAELGWRPRTPLREGLASTLRAIVGPDGGTAGPGPARDSGGTGRMGSRRLRAEPEARSA